MSLQNNTLIQALSQSSNPIVALKTRLLLLDESPDSPAILALREQIRAGQAARDLLFPYREGFSKRLHAYAKWQGPHWTLYALAEAGYPPGDSALIPLRDRAYDWLFSPKHLLFPQSLLIPGQEDRFRRCASQEANALWYSLLLGLENEHTSELAARLVGWQWPDGGWNCDKRPRARTSSVVESLTPLRALSLYAWLKGDSAARAVAERTAEFFLCRRLLYRLKDGSLIDPGYNLIQYPYYVFYNFFFALLVMAEAGLVKDPRCVPALDLLESKRLPDGGFPAESKVYRFSQQPLTRGSCCDWGPHGKTRQNDYVTVDALYILKEAGRL